MAAIREVGFGPDLFNNPIQENPIESLGKIIYRMFVMRPGTMPSMPHIGIDIRQYMYRPEGTINFEKLQDKIIVNCADLLQFMTVGDIHIDEVRIKDQLTLVVVIKATIEGEEYALISAMKKGMDNEILHSFRAESLRLNEN